MSIPLPGRHLSVLALAGVLLGTEILVAPSARAGSVTCTYDSNTKIVTATATSDFDQVAIHRDGDAIEASGTDCGSSTRFNTDKIIVNDVASHELTAFVLPSSGPFRPGFTDEPGSSDEIEFEYNLGTQYDTFIVRGSDQMRAGIPPGLVDVQRFNLNAGESTGVDADVVVEDAEEWSLQGTDGPDLLSAAGGAGTGEVLNVPIHLSGEDEGADVLVGGLGMDDLNGYLGVDKLSGGPGDDDLAGGGGNDVLRGNGDNDTIHGDNGNDKLYGASGNDDLFGDDGDDYLYGGGGFDECNAGSGTNVVTGCD